MPDLSLFTDLTFVALDTETTGLQPLAGRIVELGAVRFDARGAESDSFSQLVDPRQPIPPDAQAVNGISDAMVRGQPTIDAALPAFVEFLGPPDTLLVAHNAPFDLGFLAVEMVRLGMAFPEHRVFDTLAMARSLFAFRSNSLDSVARQLGVAPSSEHRARADARLTKGVFLEMLRRHPDLQALSLLGRKAPPLRFTDAGFALVSTEDDSDALAKAIRDRKPVMMRYEGKSQPRGDRMATPLAVFEYRGVEYLSAVCHIDGRRKTFRLDRIVSLEIAGERM
ncbi:MAG: exonuclease domain-containing protein [Candidatus Sumerlaeota bacterium]|nr:exonuclease domain-containing protein [Candidatus Sumerlaeota bacterium]